MTAWRAGVELASNCRRVASERDVAFMLLTAATSLALHSVSHGFLAGLHDSIWHKRLPSDLLAVVHVWQLGCWRGVQGCHAFLWGACMAYGADVLA